MTEDEASTQIKQLRVAGQFDEAVQIGYEHLKTFPKSYKVRGALSWSIYSAKVKGFTEAGNQSRALATAVREIRKLSEPNPYGKISAYVLAVHEAVSLLAEAGRHTVALELLKEIDSTKLMRDVSVFKEKKIPSQLERWYNDLTKALASLEDLSNLKSVCEEALSSGLYKSDEDKVWLRYRLAIALVDTDPASALELIDQVKKIKNESWLIRHRARCLYNLGQQDQAEQECRVALGGVNVKKPEFAIPILEDMFNYTEDDETAVAILQSLRAIRLKNNWSAKSEYEISAKELDCSPADNFDVEETIKRFADGDAFRSQKRDSTDSIPRTRGKSREPEKILGEGVVGVIVRLLPTQPNVAFAKVEGRGDVLISGSGNSSIPWPPEIGMKVRGRLVETLDRKKNKMGAKLVAAEMFP